jgi:methylthioribose-1-phosphate isomerase
VILEADGVRILDRRVFPFERRYVTCRDYEEVARAIEEMVTQSGGPFQAATAGLVLAARDGERRRLSPQEQKRLIVRAAERLVATRRTNGQIAAAMARLMVDVERAETTAGQSFAAVLDAAVQREWRMRDEAARRVGEAAAELVPDGARLLTHCWGESVIISTLEAVLAAGKQVSVLCTETRPYLQGARLTAESVAELGIPTRVITDGMGASVMSAGKADLLVTAADRVTSDGYVVNKVGTLQLAIAAKEFHLPYYALVRAPDLDATGPDSVPLEERDGDEVLHCLGHRTASWKAQGYYPSFDVTPPRYVTNVVTTLGAFTPADLRAGHTSEDLAGAHDVWVGGRA